MSSKYTIFLIAIIITCLNQTKFSEAQSNQNAEALGKLRRWLQKKVFSDLILDKTLTDFGKNDLSFEIMARKLVLEKMRNQKKVLTKYDQLRRG